MLSESLAELRNQFFLGEPGVARVSKGSSKISRGWTKNPFKGLSKLTSPFYRPRRAFWQGLIQEFLSASNQRYTIPARMAPATGASQKSHSWDIAHPPWNIATPELLAGLTDVLVIGMLIR